MTRIAFWSWLNRWGNGDQEWIRARFDLWKRTALASILAQRAGSWRYALLCGPLHRDFTASLREEIDDSRVTLVHAGGEERAWRARLPSARVYVHARLDSDDMLHPDAAACLIKGARKKGTWLRFSRGYAWHSPTGRLFHWRQPTSPFYASVEDGAPFRRAREAFRPRHNDQRLAAARRLPPGHFLVHLHDQNTTTGLSARFLEAEIGGAKREKLLAEFGVPA